VALGSPWSFPCLMFGIFSPKRSIEPNPWPIFPLPTFPEAFFFPHCFGLVKTPGPVSSIRLLGAFLLPGWPLLPLFTCHIFSPPLHRNFFLSLQTHWALPCVFFIRFGPQSFFSRSPPSALTIFSGFFFIYCSTSRFPSLNVVSFSRPVISASFSRPDFMATLLGLLHRFPS